MESQKKPSYWHRLFSGRLNRQNYIVGSTVLVLPATICFTIVLMNVFYAISTETMPYLDPTNPSKLVVPPQTIRSVLFTQTNELLVLVGAILLILSIPYLISLQIKRQHDLNLPGWLWIINIFSFTSFYTYFPNAHAGLDTPVGITLNVLATIAGIFSVYCTFWPGTKGINKYGDPTLGRTSLRHDVLALSD